MKGRDKSIKTADDFVNIIDAEYDAIFSAWFTFDLNINDNLKIYDL